jgi:hypothetical protein
VTEDPMSKGWKTSEFWMALAGKVFGLLALFGVHPALPAVVSGVVSAVGGILATGATVAYSLSRAKVKAAELTAAPVQIVPIVKATLAELDARLMDLPIGLGGSKPEGGGR